MQVMKDADKLPIEGLWGYRVKVWNSGSEPLNDLPIEFHFSGAGSPFYCVAEHHNAPKRLDGAISDFAYLA